MYVSVSFTIRNRVDEELLQAANEIILPFIQGNERGELAVQRERLTLELPTDIYLQLYHENYTQFYISPNIAQFSSPLDPVNLRSPVSVWREVTVGTVRLRILTVPLFIGNRMKGVMQVGTGLDVVIATQSRLGSVLLIGIPLAISLAALTFWYSTRQVLAPVENVTHVATQITRADDLSRRIPYNGPQSDEVGQLISAFNQTLGRLETLFNTQRRFLTDVGHELRTPLTVIQGNTSLMRRMGCGDEESLSSIESEVDRLTRLVGDLLLLAQAESGKIPMVNQVVELDTLLLEVMGQMSVLARDRLTLRLGDIDQVLVCGDRDRMKQVLVNLIGNAINYTPQGGMVVVGLSKAQNQARLTVSDNGPGIPAEDLPHIFERFYRGEKSRPRARDGKGFGLGLSIAYWIVRNHNGRIEVDSKVGAGTTFCVWLPLSQENCQARETSGAAT